MKLKLIAVLSLVLATMVTSTTAQAKPSRWENLSIVQKQVIVRETITRAQGTVRWWLGRRALVLRIASANNYADQIARQSIGLRKIVWCQTMNMQAPGLVCDASVRLLHARELLAQLEARRVASLLPPDCRGGATRQACEWYFDGATQCEVSHEGGWTTDSNWPYAGRFQMDQGFETSGDELGPQMERLYGRASHWPSWAQIQHAYNLWLNRGWNPWPPYYRYGCSYWHDRSYNGTVLFYASAN